MRRFGEQLQGGGWLGGGMVAGARELRPHICSPLGGCEVVGQGVVRQGRSRTGAKWRAVL